MKALFLSILICFASIQSFADCAGSGIYVLPATTTTLSETPVIIIEGYYMDQEMIRNLGKKYTLYLESNKDLIQLIPVEILEGEMHLTQVILKPAKSLKTDTEYELYAESIPGNPSAVPDMIDLGIPDSKWMVKAINDKIVPVFTTAPKWMKSSVTYFGCGPSNYMEFKFETEEKNQYFIRTTVKNTKDDTQTTYYLTAVDGLLSVGHGMCSGAFKPKAGVKYELEFSLVDGSWNKGKTLFCKVVYDPENPY